MPDIGIPTDKEFEQLARNYWGNFHNTSHEQRMEFINWSRRFPLPIDIREKFERISHTVRIENKILSGTRERIRKGREEGLDYTDLHLGEVNLFGTIQSSLENENPILSKVAGLFSIYAGYGVLYSDISNLLESTDKLEEQIVYLIAQLNLVVEKTIVYDKWKGSKIEMVEIELDNELVNVAIFFMPYQSG